MADKKVTELTAITNVSGDDLLLVVNDPLGTPASRKVTLKNFFANVSVSQVFTASSRFNSNTVFSGTTSTFHSNVMLGSTHALNAIKDRMQVANTNALFVDSQFSGNTDVYRIRTSNSYPFQVPVRTTPTASTNAALELMEGSARVIPAGTVWFANSNIYVATDANNIKRTKLSHYPSPITFRTYPNTGNTALKVSGGGASTDDNQTLYLYKGFTYEFRSDRNHPIEIRNSSGGSAFSNGVNQIGTQTLYFTVPQAQVSNLVYQCTVHAAMVGTIVIV